jgi:OOP family OmpA-OmpF porin
MTTFQQKIHYVLAAIGLCITVNLTFAATPEKPASAPAAFNIESVPMSSIALPPFPYLSYPAGMTEVDDKTPALFSNPNSTGYSSSDEKFDQAYVIAGANLRQVEGRITFRTVLNEKAGLSALGLLRNYTKVIKAMGGVKVNTILPTQKWLEEKNLIDNEKMLERAHLPRRGWEEHDVYLIRNTQGNVWIALSQNGGFTEFLVIKEQEMEQTVAMLTADNMANALKQDGHVPLYLSFDTNRDVIRQESLAAVNEIVKLLRAQPTLGLQIEGHTDNIGEKNHNQSLSLARAQSVMRALTGQKIDSSRLSAVGLGASKPINNNASEEGRAKNRRVELVRR